VLEVEPAWPRARVVLVLEPAWVKSFIFREVIRVAWRLLIA
jgi:hypothetical protein